MWAIPFEMNSGFTENNKMSRIKTKIFIKNAFPSKGEFSQCTLKSQSTWYEKQSKIIHGDPAGIRRHLHNHCSGSESDALTKMAANVTDALFIALRGLDFITILL